MNANVVYRVVGSSGKPLKRRLKNGERLTIVRTYLTRVGGGNLIPPDDCLVIEVTPERP